MGKGRNILRAVYTSIIVVIYLLFFSVQCVFKYTSLCEYSDTAATLISAVHKAGNNTTKWEKGHSDTSDLSIRLNKRFHPENIFLVASMVYVTTLVHIKTFHYHSFYENPVPSLVCLSRSLRAPPFHA